MPEDNGWREWSRFVLKELERHKEGQEHLGERIQCMEKDIVVLKLKAGVWGLLGASIPVAIDLLIRLGTAP